MTDITDQDRRNARQWAKNWQGDLDADISAAARVILATVDAPEPTLTERLREQFYDPEPTDEQHGIILDAAQMEHDLAEARAEVERLSERVTARLPMPPGDIPGTALPINISAIVPDPTTPNPADVQPGEAWIVEVNREKRTAVKDRSDIQPWNTVNAGGWLLTEDDEDVTLVARLVPEPRTVRYEPKEK